MNDKFNEIMNRHRAGNQQAPSQRSTKPLSPEAQAYFSRPANFCQFCGGEVGDHPEEAIDKWQKKWSIHKACQEAASDQLDRRVGILSERKS